MGTDNSGNINCLKCKHYTVTWNPKFPNACKLLGIKSSVMPSALVYESTGKLCEGFEKKGEKKQAPVKAGESLGANTQSVIISIGNREECR